MSAPLGMAPALGMPLPEPARGEQLRAPEAARRPERTDAPDPELLEAAQEFESLLLHMVLRAMRDTVPENEMFGSQRTKMWEGLQDEEMSRAMARQGGLGLADVIARQLDDSAAEARRALGGARDVGRRLQALQMPADVAPAGGME